jgi:AcrR family transcriptional regulator
LARIAERAGISKGVVLNYFKNKEALIEQVVIEVYTAAALLVTPQIAAQLTAALKLPVYISSALEYIRSHRKQMIALVELMGLEKQPRSGCSAVSFRKPVARLPLQAMNME